MTYDLDYFIDKFEKIPESKWCIGQFEDREGRCCALGHACKMEDGLDRELCKLTRDLDPRGYQYSGIAGINDNPTTGFPQPTPKKRVLAYLRALKDFWR